MKKLKDMKKKRGFTLIELIVVIAILAILAAVIIPRIIGYTHQATTAKEQADAKVILTAIQTHNSDDTAGTSQINIDNDTETVADLGTNTTDTTLKNTIASLSDTTVESSKVEDLNTLAKPH